VAFKTSLESRKDAKFYLKRKILVMLDAGEVGGRDPKKIKRNKDKPSAAVQDTPEQEKENGWEGGYQRGKKKGRDDRKKKAKWGVMKRRKNIMTSEHWKNLAPGEGRDKETDQSKGWIVTRKRGGG